MSYKSLACAVLGMAVLDAKRGRADARRFLMAIDGPWARSRVFWCQVAGVDPDGFLRALKTAKQAEEDALQRGTP